MKDRFKKRRKARCGLRRDLVHAAGCTEPNCSSKYYMDPEILDEVRNAEGERTVSVPRSLRHIIGRWL